MLIKMGRGGKRPGAGRKMISDTPRVALSARVSQATKETLQGLRAQGLSMGQLLDRIVAAYVNENRGTDISV